MKLIQGGKVVSSSAISEIEIQDILIDDDKVLEVGKNLPVAEGAEIVDAAGMYVLPGGIDPHVHFRLNAGGIFASDDFATGSQAALLGGTTTVLDFVTPKNGQSMADALSIRKQEAAGCFCDYGFHQSVTWWDKSLTEQMKEMVTREGIRSFKVYMAYKNAIGINDDLILRVMEEAAKLGAVVLSHCEYGEAVDYLRNRLFASGMTGPEAHPASRPAELETEAVIRCMVLAGITGAKTYAVHVSTEGGLAAIHAAREKGLDVYAETCPHYLLLDKEAYSRPWLEAAKYIMSPPLRDSSDRSALWSGLQAGMVQSIGTDHCPFFMEQKELGREDFRKLPNGIPGVANRLQLLYTYGVRENRISLQDMVYLTAENPAKIFGLSRKKGSIQPGKDADLVLWDPNWEGEITAETDPHNCDFTPYEGMKVKGRAAHVFFRGTEVVKNAKFQGTEPAGKYLKR